MKWVASLTLSKHITYNLENLVYVLARHLVALGITSIANLLGTNATHVVTGAALQDKFGRACQKGTL